MLNPSWTPYRRVEIGQLLPEFRLRDQSGALRSPRDHLGTRLLLVFLGTSPRRCRERLLNRLAALVPHFRAYDVDVLLISPSMLRPEGVSAAIVPREFPLVVDPFGMVHQRYGAVDWSNRPALSLFLADRWGQTFYRALTGFGERFPSSVAMITLIASDAIAPSYPLGLNRRY